VDVIRENPNQVEFGNELGLIKNSIQSNRKRGGWKKVRKIGGIVGASSLWHVTRGRKIRPKAKDNSCENAPLGKGYDYN